MIWDNFSSSHMISYNLLWFQIFDKFIPRLKDQNGKVNLFALQVLYEITPLIAEHMSNVVSLTVQTVASNLASKNKDILTAAILVLDIFAECIGMPLIHYHPSQASLFPPSLSPSFPRFILLSLLPTLFLICAP